MNKLCLFYLKRMLSYVQYFTYYCFFLIPGVVKKTHSFILTDEMLEKHFALFYAELEPCKIADEMFQTGLISISEHDDVTDYKQKHKRLRGLVDILKRKCLHAPFLSLLQSMKYSLLLDTLQNERELNYKLCKYFKIIVLKIIFFL